MLFEQSILQAIIEERRLLVIAAVKSKGQPEESSLQAKIRNLDKSIRAYLIPDTLQPTEVKREYDSDCDSEAPSEATSLFSRTTVEFHLHSKRKGESSKSQEEAHFDKVFRKTNLFVKYIKTRNKQHYRQVRSRK